MIRKHRIIVQNKRVKYDFEVRRNITIIRGDSATGKTSLIEMIREYNELEEDSGVELQCDKNCVALSGINWKIQLEAISDSIVFIDEGNAFVMSKEFATMVQDSDNYYVLVIADGAAFGSEIDKIVKIIEGRNNIELFLPESFEWKKDCNNICEED